MRDGRPVTVEVTSDGAGLVSHAGSALVAQVADKVGLTNALSVRLAGIKQRRRGHDPGRVIRDLAVMLVDGGECVSDLGAVREQETLFGSVASDSTAFRMVDRIASTPGLLDAVRVAHARARARFWEVHGAPQRLTLDVDATLITSHSEKENAAGNYKGGYGFHPLQVYLDETREAMGGLLRAGNAGSNTAEDHQTVIDRALAQIPAEYIESLEILVRADTAGATHGLVDYCRDGNMRFSVGFELTEPIRAAILEIPEDAWVVALDQDGSERENGEVCEITDMVDLSAWPEGSRLIVRRERPHPGAQLSFTDHDGYRFQAILTDQTDPEIAVLECRHRQPRARRGPDPRRQGHRPVQVPVQGVRAQRGVVGDRDARARPARLDPSTRPRRRVRQGRTQTHPLPPLAHRRSSRVLRPPREAPPPGHVAVGNRARRRLREAQSAPSPHRLTAATGRPHHHAGPSGHGRDDGCPHTRHPKRHGPAEPHHADKVTLTTPGSPHAGSSVTLPRLLHVPG